MERTWCTFEWKLVLVPALSVSHRDKYPYVRIKRTHVYGGKKLDAKGKVCQWGWRVRQHSRCAVWPRTISSQGSAGGEVFTRYCVSEKSKIKKKCLWYLLQKTVSEEKINRVCVCRERETHTHTSMERSGDSCASPCSRHFTRWPWESGRAGSWWRCGWSRDEGALKSVVLLW